MTNPDDPRHCQGVNRRGEPCGAPPMRDSGYCCSHDPDRPAARRFGSAEQQRAAALLGGRPRVAKPREIARQLAERHAELLVAPYWRALGYGVVIGDDGLRLEALPEGAAKLHGVHEGQVLLSPHDDLMAALTVSEKLLDRIYGRPKTMTELTGAGGGPIELHGDGRPDLRKLTDGELIALERLMEKAEANDPPAA